METTQLNIADEKFSKKKTLGFALLRLGNILAGLMIGEVTYFATNSLGIAAAAISIGVAIKTAIDALTDLVMGTIVDPLLIRRIVRWERQDHGYLQQSRCGLHLYSFL